MTRKRLPVDDARRASSEDASLDQGLVVSQGAASRHIEIRPGEGAMLTASSAASPNLDAFFEAIVELLLERLEQLTAKEKENKPNEPDP